MVGNNLKTIQFSETQKKEILNALNNLEKLLKPFIINLTPRQKDKTPDIQVATLPFVTRVIQHIDNNGASVPVTFNADLLKSDLNTLSVLSECYFRLSGISELINDTIKLIGNEAYKFALQYFNFMENSAKLKDENAQEIYEDLKAYLVKPPEEP